MIYVASKTKHARRWVALRDTGVPIVSTWIDEAGPGESVSLQDLWVRCITEASTADAVLLYTEPGDGLKGALVEVGAALAFGVPVYVVGDGTEGSWVCHPCVVRVATIEEAVNRILATTKITVNR